MNSTKKIPPESGSAEGKQPTAVSTTPETGFAHGGRTSQQDNIPVSASVLFFLLIVFVWLDEVIDIPHLLFGAPTSPINWFELVLETIVIAGVAALVLREMMKRRRVERELRVSEDIRDNLFNHMTSGVAVYEAVDGGNNFIFRDFNPAAEKIEKIKREEILGKRVTEAFPGVEDFGLFAVFQRVWKTGEPENLRDALYRDERDPGSWRENHVYKLPSGEIVAVYDDITARKQVEEVLRTERDKLKQIFEAMVDGIYIANQNYDIEYVNPVLVADFGPYENRKCYAYFHDRDEICPWCKNMEVWAGKTVRWEWYSSRNDRTYDLIDTPLHNADGSISKLEIFRDITGRKQAEEALRKREQEFTALVKNAQDIIARFDKEGRHLYINPAVEHISGIPPETFIGKTNREMGTPEDLAVKWDEALTSIFKTGQELTIETELPSPTGTIYYSNRLVPEFAEDGSVETVLNISRDITEQKKLENEFRQAQKMEAIGRLAGGIAHDFNNTLTVINGNIELILHDLPDESPYHSRILNIREAATHAAALTRQLLAFSRKQIAEPRILDINDTISDIRNMLQRVIGEDIRLTFLPDDDIGNIFMDPEQITQVLMNLVVNAREAMPRGGALVVETAQMEIDEHYVNTHSYISPGLYARIMISDTGIGMSDEVRDQVFEPFYTTKESGTGLGLSTVFGIVKQNGGSINVYSEVGVGTTFKIYLPITRERAEADPAEAGEADHPEGSETILLVEDEDTVRNLAVEILTHLGYEVHDFAGGKEALLFAEDHKETIDLLLTDVVMPGMDGPELTNAVQETCPSVRVLYMSGYTDNAIAHHGMLHEGVNLLQKPFTLSGIAKKVREVLDADRSD